MSSVIVVIFVMWCVYSLLEGTREGDYVHLLNLSSVKFGTYKEHSIWSCQRFSVYYIVLHCCWFILMTTEHPIWSTILTVTCFPLSFIFFHDGEFYRRMHQLDKTLYSKGFCDFSTTSTSWFDRNKLTIWPLRLTYFIAALIEIIILLILNKNI